MKYETIIVQKTDDGIVKIIMNRPEVLNAMNGVMLKEIIAALEEIVKSKDVAAVILTGAGRAFTAGRDLKAAGDFFEGGDPLKDINLMIQRLGPPVIAAVNGYAITGGFELAMACDIIIASENAIFRDTHAQVGLVPGSGNTQRLPRLVGEKKAKEILFTSDRISGTEAEKIGLANKVVPADKLDEEAMVMAKKIAVQPKHMIQKLKQVVSEGMLMDFRAALMFEQLQSREWQEKLSPEQLAAQGQNAIKGGRDQEKK